MHSNKDVAYVNGSIAALIISFEDGRQLIAFVSTSDHQCQESFISEALMPPIQFRFSNEDGISLYGLRISYSVDVIGKLTKIFDNLDYIGLIGQEQEVIIL